MNRIVLFHGSDQVVEKPTYGKGDLHNDYGNAYYCTKDLYAAKEWANKKEIGGFANKYTFDGRGLNVLDLTDKNEYNVLHWFAILMHFRDLDPDFKEDYDVELAFLEKNYFIDLTQYDVVIGFRADDSYFRFPLMFIRGQIRLERLEEIYKLGYLDTQIAILSEKAFQRLSFVEAIPAEPIYRDKYRTRIMMADERFKEIAKQERWLEGTRLQDLIKHNDKR